MILLVYLSTNDTFYRLLCIKDTNIEYRNEKVIIYSDSAYAINCYLQEWYVNWQANGWRNANKKEVANQDLWKKIDNLLEEYRAKNIPVVLDWVKAFGCC